MKTKLHIVFILTLSFVWFLLPLTLVKGATTNQISQFGITWTFDKEYEYGQFANGDYWVVGPVTIIGIDPPSFVGDGVRTMETGTPDEEWVPEVGRTVNGAMINPDLPEVLQEGYDSYNNLGPTKYNESLNVARKNGLPISALNPLVLSANTSLISSISLDHNNPGYMHHGYQGYILKTAAILTVLEKSAPAGSFRPPYCGTDKTIKFNESQLNYHLLKTLDKKDFCHWEDLKMKHWTDAQDSSAERMVHRPWIQHIARWSGEIIAPAENMLSYPGYRTGQLQEIAMLLNVDWTGSDGFVSNKQYKRNLLVSTVQLGIDLYGIYQTGSKNCWLPDGGHGIGRKWPILFAGVMLEGPDAHQDAVAMANIGFNPDDDPHFSEDDQSFYVNQANLDAQNAIYDTGAWAMGVYGPDPRDPFDIPYTQEDVDSKLPEWGIRYATEIYRCNRAWNTYYRRNQTNANYPGFVLSMHIMGLKERWNHDSFFNYMDRYIAIEKEIKATIVETYRQKYKEDPSVRLIEGYSYGYIYDSKKGYVPVEYNIPGTPATDVHNNPVHEQFLFYGICSSDFAAKMWDEYRADYGPVWTPESESGSDEPEDGLEDKIEVKCFNNVFNPTKGEEALIWIELPKQARVKVVLYNTRGNKIRKLVDKEEDPGPCRYYWNGKDDSGSVVGSGLYFVHIQAGDYRKTKKIVVVK